MTNAIRVHEFGGADVLRWEEIDVPAPAPGELLLRHTAIGLNFLDVYHRSGLYPLALPFIPGSAAAGVVEAIGDDVAGFRVGDRVAYAGPIGAYAESRVVPAGRVVPVPSAVSDDVAASCLLQGLTARYLLLETYPVSPGQTILVHAAAGGVGLLLCQWARALGVTVIGTTSTESKAALATAHGCTYATTLTGAALIEFVRGLTDGAGVPVVYDSVGAATFQSSIDCLAPRGMLVSYGNASGPAPAVEPGLLARKGSLFLTRPTLGDYIVTTETLRASAADFFACLAAGTLTATIGQRFALRDTAQAHIALESRTTQGSTVLTV